IYTLSGGGRSLAETAKFARDVVQPALEQVDGVAQVDVKGGAEREVHVNLDLARIDALKLSPMAIMAQLKAENLTVPAGHYDEGSHEIAVRTVGEFKDVDEIRNVIVATAADGSAVRLSDIASVDDGYEELRTRIRANGEQAVSFQVVKQSGKNTVAVADGAKAKLAQIEKTFPAGMTSSLIVDQSKFIRENVHEVEISIIFGGAMAILIILLFMLDLRSTLISSVALPTSVISTFFVMYLLHFSLNMMTLLGLSLAIGLLIDDAIVMIEHIARRTGVPGVTDPNATVLTAAREFLSPLLGSSLATTIIFVPLAFLSGVTGAFFKFLSFTVASALIISFILTAFTVPLLARGIIDFNNFHDPSHGRETWLKRTHGRVLRRLFDRPLL
ncbi:MAG: efflux RND transporter permease subunit, partial [Polyangiaceae bacterium]